MASGTSTERLDPSKQARIAAMRLVFESATGPASISTMHFLQTKERTMADKHPQTWPDLLIGLYDNLTGRRAEITYEFDNMHVKIPSGTGASAEHAEWILHGAIKIRTRDTGNSPK